MRKGDGCVIIIFFRAILLYIVVIFGIRVMGKRQLGELQPAELVITILISNIATLPIEDTDVPLLGGIVPILTLVSFEVIMSAISLKSRRARRIISGNPRVVIRDGTLDQQEMRNLRFSVDDLMGQLRQNGIFDIQDVDYAIVETTGQLTVYKRFAAQEVTAEMLNLKEPKSTPGLPVIVVNDGDVVKEALLSLRIGEEWLMDTLRRKKLTPKQVFLMTCDRDKNYFIVEKENKGEKG